VLIALSLLYPAFPNRHVARGGLLGALLLFATLTWIHLPDWCLACLVAHLCHLLIWAVWCFVPAQYSPAVFHPGMRLCLLFVVPVSMVALFSSLNLTFLAYGFQAGPGVVSVGLNPGDPVPVFTARTIEGRAVAGGEGSGEMVLNFVTPDCPWCREQLQILYAVTDRSVDSPLRIINISPTLPPATIQSSPLVEWVEDRDGALEALFRVHGYPTMFVVGSGGRILQVIPGVPNHLKENLQKLLVSP